MSEIRNLERQAENARQAVEQRDAIVKLTSLPEFRKLIVEGFCKDECARFTHMSSDPNLSVQDRADALASAQAAGHLKRWINGLILMGNRAEQDIVEVNAMIEEIRASGEDE